MKEIEIYDIQPLARVAYVPTELIWLILLILTAIVLIIFLFKIIKRKNIKKQNNINNELKIIKNLNDENKQIALISEFINSLLVINYENTAKINKIQEIKKILNDFNYSAKKSEININEIISKLEKVIEK